MAINGSYTFTVMTGFGIVTDVYGLFVVFAAAAAIVVTEDDDDGFQLCVGSHKIHVCLTRLFTK